jgi:hypothetical protein
MGFFFLSSFSGSSLLELWKSYGLYEFILCPATLLKVFTRPNHFQVVRFSILGLLSIGSYRLQTMII